MGIETEVLNVGQRYNLEDLRLVGWEDSYGERVGIRPGRVEVGDRIGMFPSDYFDEEDYYLGPDAEDHGIEPVFEYDTESQPHF